MRQNEKKGHGGKHTRPKKWSGARRPAGPATTALVSRGTMIKSTKYAISVRQKQKDSLASSKSLFDKGGATQRTRKSIYVTAITARFFLAVGSTVIDSLDREPPSLINLLCPHEETHLVLSRVAIV